MNSKGFLLTAAVLGLGIGIAAVAPAFAADSANWIAPAEKGVTSLTESIVSIAAGVIGFGIVCLGIWAAMTQRLEWAKLWIFIFAAILITVGPKAISWFIDLMKA